MAIRQVLACKRMQAILNNAILSRVGATTLHRLLSHQTSDDALEWSLPLTMLVAHKPELLIHNEVKCMMALLRHRNAVLRGELLVCLQRLNSSMVQQLRHRLSMHECAAEQKLLSELRDEIGPFVQPVETLPPLCLDFSAIENV